MMATHKTRIKLSTSLTVNSATKHKTAFL